MAVRSSCLKLTTRLAPRALNNFTTALHRPFLVSRSFHISPWTSAQPPAAAAVTPASKAANMAEDPSIKMPPSGSSFIKRMSVGLRELMPSSTEEYVGYGITQQLYNECVNQAAYVEGLELSESAKFWYEVCKRQPTFAAWSQVTVLHMWMLIVRIRAFEPDKVQIWQQHFVDHLFYDSEAKMIETYKLTSGGQRKGYLKDLYSQYRGMIAGFDEGLCKGDAVLASAIWRNVFDANPDVDVELLAIITSYVRRVISGLDRVSDDIMSVGGIEFGLPMDEEPHVMHKSRYLEMVIKDKDHVKTVGDVDGEKTDDRLNKDK